MSLTIPYAIPNTVPSYGIYQSLLTAMKRRIMDETELAFDQHPAFSEKVKVFNKFPFDERIQYGMLLRNASASQIRLSPDNFMSDLISHVRVARQTAYPGLAIEWVRENIGNITKITTEDVSSQLGSTQRKFITSQSICSGPDETHYSGSPGQVYVTVNGTAVVPDYVDGKTGTVILPSCPGDGSTVIIQYYYRNLVPYGLYAVDFIEDNQFTVAPLYIIENEVLIDLTTGTETTAQLAHFPIELDSEQINLAFRNNVKIEALTRGTDYNININTGLITFLVPLMKNYRITADYRYQPQNYVNGPYTFKEYQENHVAIPGIVLSIGRRAKKGDQQIVVVSQFREQQARIYGGHWEMSLEMAAIAKDPMQMEQMTEHLVSYLWGQRKNDLEFEGITLNRVEPSGESEEIHIDTTGDLYFESTVSINLQSEWQRFAPYLPILKIKNITIVPDVRPVFKGPVVGYERLT
jgi:hypothetical protein